MAADAPSQTQRENRPLPSNRHSTAPSVMTVNGHFANVGEKASAEQYEHGIQVINEHQDFKYEKPRLMEPVLTSSLPQSKPAKVS